MVSVSDGGAARARRDAVWSGLAWKPHDETNCAGQQAFWGFLRRCRWVCPTVSWPTTRIELAELLGEILAGAAPGTWCAATWRGDGHPDHEAVGRAAAAACARTGVALLEYPVWMWHWASPSDPAVPWERAHSVPVSGWALERKRLAAQCFRSQFEPGTP